MGQFFTHDPFTWDFGDKTHEKHQQIFDERANEGYSFYDWINFDDYLTSLNNLAMRNINIGFISVSDDVHRKVMVLRGTAHYLHHEELRIDYIEPIDLAMEHEKQFVLDTVEWNREFYREIFPNLPFTDDYSPEKLDRSRVIHPMDNRVMGSFIQYVLIDGLQKFVDQGAGYPALLSGFSEWKDKLESYIHLFENVHNWDSEFDQVVFDDFMKYFPSLWD